MDVVPALALVSSSSRYGTCTLSMPISKNSVGLTNRFCCESDFDKTPELRRANDESSPSAGAVAAAAGGRPTAAAARNCFDEILLIFAGDPARRDVAHTHSFGHAHFARRNEEGASFQV